MNIFAAINGPNINETAINYMEILTQLEMAPNTFCKWLNIPLKINVP